MSDPGNQRRSLMQTHRKRIDVPALLLLSIALLVAGVLLPVMHTEKLLLWRDTYSIATGIGALMKEGYILLAAILFFFSMVFPIIKLILLAVMWFARLDGRSRARALRWLGIAGKWSMLDVFVVAIIIVITQLGGAISAEPRVGLYLFAAAVVASMATTMIIEKLAGRVDVADA